MLDLHEQTEAASWPADSTKPPRPLSSMVGWFLTFAVLTTIFALWFFGSFTPASGAAGGCGGA